ncbi:MAG: hypothetical protein WDO15_14050 [Bacteroidota bacterium]
MKTYLGEFEELVLLTIATLGQEAYGVAIKDRLSSGVTGASASAHSIRPSRGWRKRNFFARGWVARLPKGAVEANVTTRSLKTARLPLSMAKSLRDELWADAKINLSIQK